MKKCMVNIVIAFTFIASTLFVGVVAANSSVWKITKGNDFVYIAGTIHILPSSEFPLPKEFDQAYQATNNLVLETKVPDESDVDLQVKMMQAMTYNDGQSLKSVLSKRTYQQLQRHIAALGADLAMFELFKPGALVSMLAMLEAQKAQLSGEGVDSYFSKRAIENNKAVAYLESVEFQMNMLANMGRGHEDQFIKSNLKQMKDFKPMFVKLIDAWRRGDTITLSKLAIEPMLDDPKSLKTLLTDRNRNWISQIESMFTANGKGSDKEFILVGIAHLVGRDNVLSLLKAKGYRVEKL